MGLEPKRPMNQYRMLLGNIGCLSQVKLGRSIEDFGNYSVAHRFHYCSIYLLAMVMSYCIWPSGLVNGAELMGMFSQFSSVISCRKHLKMQDRITARFQLNSVSFHGQ